MEPTQNEHDDNRRQVIVPRVAMRADVYPKYTPEQRLGFYQFSQGVPGFDRDGNRVEGGEREI